MSFKKIILTPKLKIFSFILLSIFSMQNIAFAQNCENLGSVTGTYDCDISFDGKNREYTLFVPNSIDSENVPLVVDMHSYLTSRGFQKNYSGWEDKAIEEGFIVVYPQGINGSWNADICCGNNQEDDVGTIRAIVEQVRRNFNIDDERTFATGFSNGGALSHRLACEASDIFRGIAAAAFPITRTPQTCNPSQPTTIVHFHGLSDNVIPYNGGGGFNAPPTPTSFQYWAEIQSCQAGPAITYTINNAICETYSQCNNNKTNTLCTINGNHLLYNNSDDLSIPDVAWEYLNNTMGDDDNGDESLTASGSKGSFLFWRWVDISWNSTTVNSVDIYRNGNLVARNRSQSNYRDFVNFNNGQYEYQVCKAGSTDICSESFSISF